MKIIKLLLQGLLLITLLLIVTFIFSLAFYAGDEGFSISLLKDFIRSLSL